MLKPGTVSTAFEHVEGIDFAAIGQAVGPGRTAAPKANDLQAVGGLDLGNQDRLLVLRLGQGATPMAHQAHLRHAEQIGFGHHAGIGRPPCGDISPGDGACVCQASGTDVELDRAHPLRSLLIKESSGLQA